jgi:hypothetical protein
VLDGQISQDSGGIGVALLLALGQARQRLSDRARTPSKLYDRLQYAGKHNGSYSQQGNYDIMHTRTPSNR